MAQLMGWGEAAAPSAENWNSSRGAGLPTPHSANASLIPAHTGEHAGLQLRSAATKHNKVWTEFIQERWGCSSLEITEAAAKLGQLSMDHFTGVTGKSNYKLSIIFAELIEIPVLRFFSHKYFWQSALHHKYFHHYSCPEDTALLQNIPRADSRNQHWTSVDWMHQFRLPEGCQALCLLQWEPSQGND